MERAETEKVMDQLWLMGTRIGDWSSNTGGTEQVLVKIQVEFSAHWLEYRQVHDLQTDCGSSSGMTVSYMAGSTRS